MIFGPLSATLLGSGGLPQGFTDTGSSTSGAQLGSVTIGGINPAPQPQPSAVAIGIGVALATGVFFLARGRR